MKAQSVRKTLTFANLLLFLGLGGAAAWYFLKVRPAAAEDTKRVAWVKPAMESYVKESANATPQVTYPVDAKAFEAITRPDLSSAKGPAVWQYVGPVPPAPKAAVAEAPKAAAPTGLDAQGRLAMVMLAAAPPESPVIGFVFNSGNKKMRSFKPGDLISDKDPGKSDGGVVESGKAAPREPGMYLLGVEKVPGEQGAPDRYRILYEIVDADATKPARREDAVLAVKAEVTGPTLIRPTTPDGKGGLATTAGGSGPRGQVELKDVRILLEPISESSYKVEFNDFVRPYFDRISPDSLIEDVKTEEVKDAAGQPKGIRITGITAGSVASQFGAVPGDILKSINDQAVHSRAEAINVVKGLSKDTTLVKVVVERNGRDILYNVDPRDPKVRAAASKMGFDKK